MRSSTGIKRLAGLLVGGLLAALSAGTLGDVTQGSRAAGLENCVAPTADIRRNHMSYLKHDRVVTVQRGVRDTQFSLAECVDCHAAKDPAGGYLPVTGKGQFCQGCHNYVAVSLSCFQCHRKTPDDGSREMRSSSQEGNQLPLVRGAPALATSELQRLHAVTLED